MCEDYQPQLPFYAVGALCETDRAAVVAHLAVCAACRAAAAEWDLVAAAVQAETAARAVPLPPLSPLLRASLRRRPTPAQAARSAANLVGAQRALLLGRGFWSALLLILALVALATVCLRDELPVALPLLALVPLAAALSVAFLYGPETDPAYEVVSVTPTPPGALLLARLTLVLGDVAGLATLASLPLSLMDHVALASLISAWLGPLLLLSALATALALLWEPLVAVSVTLALWAGVVVLLGAELGGQPLIRASLRPLLRPGWLLFAAQVAAAVLLWSLGWWLLRRDTLPARKLEAR